MINLIKESAQDNLIAAIFEIIEKVIPCPYMSLEKKKAYLKGAENFYNFIDILIDEDAEPNGYFLTDNEIYNYLRENDPTLEKSLALLNKKGQYDDHQDCQAWLLAELLVKEYKENYLYNHLSEYEAAINDFLNYHEYFYNCTDDGITRDYCY
jgi:uncharacterized protein (DUF1015 family)